MIKQPIIYMITNKEYGVIYTGVTSNLAKRIYEHKNSIIKGFASRYNCNILVFYEVMRDMVEAIAREKQIKAGSRSKKLKIIENMNPTWKDLYEDII